MKKRWILAFVNIVFVFTTIAQNFNFSQIVTIEGKKFGLYQVEQGETIFSICKKFNIGQKELVNNNPQLIDGLKQGDSIKIQFDEFQQLADNKTAGDSDFYYHEVKKSETIYSISKQYNVPINTIYKYNPEAEDEVLENEIIRIPLNAEGSRADGLVREDEDYYFHKVQAKENLYSLARQYNAKVADILDLNPTVSQGLEIGNVVRIPKNPLRQLEIESVEKTGAYFLHRIEAGDTFYSYKRRFGVDQQKLVELNPELTDGMVTGLTIKIPSGKIPKIDVIPENANEFLNHIVAKGETLYSISRKYNEKILNIKELNPELKSRGLIAGETILIPKEVKSVNTTINTESPENNNEPVKVINKPEVSVLPEVKFEIKDRKQIECRKEYSLSNDDTFRISMFLPLYYDKNDSVNILKLSKAEIAYLDSMKSIDPTILAKHFKIEIDTLTFDFDTVLIDGYKRKEARTLYSLSKFKTRDFVNFYQGVLLAIDSMQNAGAKVALSLYDSEYKSSKVDKILKNNNFMNANLIIGPVDVRLQKSVADFSKKNRIPMVSPLSSNDAILPENPYYFQVNPSKDYIIRKTSEFICDEFFDKNFIIMTLGNAADFKESKLVNLVRDKFFSTGVYNNLNEIRFTQVDYSQGGNLGYWQVKKTLKPNIENVIFIPATDNRNEREAMLSQAINSLQVLSEEFDITLVGLSDYPEFESIYTEYYHRLKLHFLTPYNIDYSSPHVNKFIKKYRTHFFDEPDLYSYSGYDVAFFFIGAFEKFGKNISECIGNYNPNLLQSEFNFQKISQTSGYMNHSLYIKKYTTDYEVKVISKITEGRIPFK